MSIKRQWPCLKHIWQVYKLYQGPCLVTSGGDMEWLWSPIAFDNVDQLISSAIWLSNGDIRIAYAVFTEYCFDLVVVNVRERNSICYGDAYNPIREMTGVNEGRISPPLSFLRTIIAGGFLFRRIPKLSSSLSMTLLSFNGFSTSNTCRIS